MGKDHMAGSSNNFQYRAAVSRGRKSQVRRPLDFPVTVIHGTCSYGRPNYP
jgi:hypothetical protein